MNRKLKLIAFVITVLMLLSMVSCSHGEDGDTSSTQSTTAEQPAIPEHHHEQTAKPVYDPDASCSIFIYMCSSNLESKSGLAGKDIDELLKADIPDKVNVVIETGGAAKWRSHDIANDKLQRYIVKNALYYFLLLHNHPPIIIHEEDRRSYFDALEAWDTVQDLLPMIAFLKEQTDKTWQKRIDRKLKKQCKVPWVQNYTTPCF